MKPFVKLSAHRFRQIFGPQPGRAPKSLALMVALCACLGIANASPAFDNAVKPETRFLVGRWSEDCARGSHRVFLEDGFRQQGMLRLAASRDAAPTAPVTPLQALREGPFLTLTAQARPGGGKMTATYTAELVSDDEIALKTMTLCLGERCSTSAVNTTWKRCPD